MNDIKDTIPIDSTFLPRSILNETFRELLFGKFIEGENNINVIQKK